MPEYVKVKPGRTVLPGFCSSEQSLPHIFRHGRGKEHGLSRDGMGKFQTSGMQRLAMYEGHIRIV